MEDYIDALLRYLDEQRSSVMSGEYVSRLAREEAAAKALCRTLTEEQHRLFLSYDNARSATASAAEDEYARAAFLLAKEIFS